MEKQYRFPGPRTFNSNESFIFFGRDDDIAQICTSIVVNPTTVLFGNSGTGKSSLIQAGILQALQRKNNEEEQANPYLPINVMPKPYDKNDSLQKKILSIVKRTLDPDNTFAQLFQSQIKPSLWYLLKQFQYKQYVIGKNQTFLLIFDQAEELFTYPDSQIEELAQELFPVIGQFIPQDLQQLLSGERSSLSPDVKTVLRSPLPVRILFSLRSDRLHLITRLKKANPHILLNSYELLPLQLEQALQCMGNPPKAEGDNFITEKFEITNETKQYIFRTLASKINDPETNFEKARIEPFGLQIICSHIEQQILPHDKDRKIQESEIPDPNTIINSYYLDCISKLSIADKDKENVRKLIEEKMLINNRRIPIHQDMIEQVHQDMTDQEMDCPVSIDTLQLLVEAKILKKDFAASGGLIFEITHDYLIKGISAAMVERKKKEGGKVLTEGIYDLLKKIEEKESANASKEITLLTKTEEEPGSTTDGLIGKKDVDTATQPSHSSLSFKTKTTVEKLKTSEGKQSVKLEKEDVELYNLYKKLSDAYVMTKDRQNAIAVLEKCVKNKNLSSKRASAYKDIGNIYLDDGEYENARLYYQKALKNNPRFADAVYNMGIVEQHLGNWDLAIKHYQKVTRLNPNDEDALSNIALIRFNNENYKEAQKIYRKLIKIYPQNENYYFNLGAIEEKLQNWDMALKYYNKVTVLNPNDQEALNKIGEVYYNKKDYQKARVECERLIAKYPKSESNYNNLGLIEETLGNWQAAIENYKKAIDINPNYEQAYNRIAGIYFTNEKYQDAKAVFENLITINPQNAYNHYNVGLTDEKLGNAEGALENYKKAVDLKPDYEDALIRIAQIYFNKEDYREAKKIYDKLIEINPNNESNYFDIGLIYEKLEAGDEALESYKKVIAINPKDEDALIRIAQIYFTKEDYQEAKKLYDRVIEINPNNESNYFDTGLINEKLENWDEAIASFEKAIELNANYKEAHEELAGVYFDRKHFGKAKEVYIKLIGIDPKNEQNYYGLALTDENLNNVENAIENYKKAIELKPDYQDAFIGMAQIYFTKEDYKEAKKLYQRLIEINPDEVNYFDMGVINEKLKNWDEAIKNFTKAIELKPDYEDAFIRIAQIHFVKEDYKEAKKLYERLIEINPDNENHYFDIAVINKNLENWDEAINNFTKAIELKPTIADFHAELGDLYDELGRTDEAIKELRLAVKYNPDNADYHMVLGFSLSRLGKDKNNLTEAMRAFQKSLKLDPDNRYTHAALGACYKKLGKESEFIKQVKKVKEMQPGTEEYVEASTEALCNNKDEALRLLKTALKKKQRSREFASNDPDFDFIRNEPEFKALIGQKTPVKKNS